MSDSKINNIPKHWQIKKLGEVCEIKNGKNQKAVVNPNGKYPIYGSAGKMGFADDFLCDAGTTIVGRKGTINKPIYVKTKFWNVDTAFGFSPKINITDSKFLFFFCQSFNFHKLDKSTTIPSLAKTDLLKIELPIPPFPEQQLIVSKIEELLSDLENGKQQLLIAQQQLKVYRQSLLKAAFEGKLTNKNVKEGELPKWWKFATLGDICDMKAGFFVKADEIQDKYKDGLFPCYGGNGLRGYTKSFTHKGTFSLVGRQGALCGNVHRVNGVFHATEHAVVTSAKEGISKDWLFYKLTAMKLNQYSAGAAQPGLSVNKLLKIEVFYPPLSEQQLIVDELESKLTVCDKIEETISQSLQQAETLKQSILKKAFEGRLI